MIKNDIISDIRSLQSILENTIYPLKDELDPMERFNHYWDVLDFINWVKEIDPETYSDYFLDDHYVTILNFGQTYTNVLKIHPINYQDGVLGIDVDINKMITDLIDFEINRKDEYAPTLQRIYDKFKKLDTIESDILSSNTLIRVLEDIKQKVNVIFNFFEKSKSPIIKKLNKKELRELEKEKQNKEIKELALQNLIRESQ